MIKNKYLIYLLSLMIMLFGQLFISSESVSSWHYLFIIQNLIIGGLLIYKTNKWFMLTLGLISLILIFGCFQMLISKADTVNTIIGFLFIIYFLIISIKVYKDVLTTKSINLEMIAAVFSGFVMLGIIGGFMFTVIEVITPNSFKNIGLGYDKIQNLNYFSFITLLTTGYGDIEPLTFPAKKMSILLGLLGNFYTTFIVAVIIGKYINSNQLNKNE